MGPVSGTYAEPGSQTYQSGRERRQFIAACRYCGSDIVLNSGPKGMEWRHTVTGDARCMLKAAPVDDVA
jgi:hypothetical protein